MAVLIVILLFVGFVVFLFIRHFEQMNHLAVHGVPGEASITKKFMKIRREIGNDEFGNRNRSDAPVPFMSYQFTVDGNSIEKEEAVSEEFYEGHEPGGTVEVLYLPTNPEMCAIKSMVDVYKMDDG